MNTMDIFDDEDNDKGRMQEDNGTLDQHQTIQYFQEKKRAKHAIHVSGSHPSVQSRFSNVQIITNPMNAIGFYSGRDASLQVPILSISHTLIKSGGRTFIILKNNDSVIIEDAR